MKDPKFYDNDDELDLDELDYLFLNEDLEDDLTNWDVYHDYSTTL